MVFARSTGSHVALAMHPRQVRIEEELAFLPGSSLFAHICIGEPAGGRVVQVGIVPCSLRHHVALHSISFPYLYRRSAGPELG